MKSNSINLLLLFTLGCVLVMGCGAIKDAKPAAERGVTQFHALFNEGKFQEIYDSSDTELKKASTLEEMVELFSAVSRKLGKVKKTEIQNWNVKSFNLTTQAVLIQKTVFEQGSGVETFTFKIDGDKAILQGYYINSNDLITK